MNYCCKTVYGQVETAWIPSHNSTNTRAGRQGWTSLPLNEKTHCCTIAHVFWPLPLFKPGLATSCLTQCHFHFETRQRSSARQDLGQWCVHQGGQNNLLVGQQRRGQKYTGRKLHSKTFHRGLQGGRMGSVFSEIVAIYMFLKASSFPSSSLELNQLNMLIRMTSSRSEELPSCW